MSALAPIEPLLNPAETLLWSGVPVAGAQLDIGSVFSIVFLLCFCGFAASWLLSLRRFSFGFRDNDLWFFLFVGFALLASGGYALFTTIKTAVIPAHIQYAVTNQRVLLVSGNPINHVDTLFMSNLQEVSLDTNGDGTGTIRFGADSYYMRESQSYRNDHWETDRYKVWILAPRLDRIPEAAKFYQLILKAKRDAAPARQSAPPQ